MNNLNTKFVTEQQVGVHLPAITLYTEFQRQRFGDKGKESLFKSFTILE